MQWNNNRFGAKNGIENTEELYRDLISPLFQIRTELEMQMVCNLREFKEFIDNEMIVILGQMDSPTQIFEHVFLVSFKAILSGILKPTSDLRQLLFYYI